MTCLQELASVTSAHIKDKAHYESALSDVRDQARVRGVEAEDRRHQLATAKENLEAALRRVASVEQVLFHPARLSLLSWALGVTQAMCLERGDVLMQCARVVQSLSRELNAKGATKLVLCGRCQCVFPAFICLGHLGPTKAVNGAHVW